MANPTDEYPPRLCWIIVCRTDTFPGRCSIQRETVKWRVRYRAKDSTSLLECRCPNSGTDARRFIRKGVSGLLLLCMSSATLRDLEPRYHLNHVSSTSFTLASLIDAVEWILSYNRHAQLQSRFPYSRSHIIQVHCNPKQSSTKRSFQMAPLYARY